MAAPTIARARPVTRTRRRTYTFDELFAMEDDVAYELDHEGHLEERALGALSSQTALNLGSDIRVESRKSFPGAVFGADISLALWPEFPRKLRRSDVAFIAESRLPGGKTPSGVLRVAPDFVAEVISPGDVAATLERKITEYFAAGVRLIWVIYPEERRAMVRRPDDTAAILGPDDHLDGEDVLPGFSVRLRDIIPDA